MFPRIIYTSLLMYLFGCATILLWQAKEKRRNGPAAATGIEEMNALKAANASLQRQIGELSATLRSVDTKVSGTESESKNIEQLTTLVKLMREGILRAGLTCTNFDGKLTGQCTKLFGLTSSEQEQLQTSILRAREAAFALEVANSNSEILPDGTQKIVVVPFPKSGGEIYDNLLHSIQNVLGPDRSAAFVSLAMPELDAAMHQYGAGERTVTIKAIRSKKEGQPAYAITQVFKTAGETQQKTMEVFDAGSLGAELGGLIKVVRH